MSCLRLIAACVLAVAVPTIAAPAAAAQSTNNYGSVYSRFGVGERADFSSSQAEMLGGAGTALRAGTAGLANPALWSDYSLTRFSLSADVRGVSSTDASDEGSRATAGGVGALQLGLPLYAGRLGLTLAYRPYSRVDYRAITTGTLALAEGDAVDYRTNYEGSGGLQQFSAGLGWRIGPALAVGASAEAYFGTVEYLQRTEFPADARFRETRTTRATRLAGATATLGAVATRTGLFGEADALTAGAALTLPARLSGERVQTLGFSLDADTLSESVSGDVTLPLQARFGLAWASGGRWTLAADARYEPWSGFESDFAFGGYDPATGASEMRDRVRVGGGFEYLPAGDERLAGYFSRTAYRLGAYTETAHVAPLGTDLTTLALTGGLSLPTLFPTARFDLGFEAGTRGSTDGVLVRDLFIRGTATINFGERWFLRRRLE